MKRIFYKASIIQDENIRVIQFTPHETFDRKIGIDNILKDMREKESNLKTQVRPGIDDWEIRMKSSSRFEYDSWDILKVSDIDPKGVVPKMKIVHKEDDPKVIEFIRKKEKQVDSDGWETVTGKRKATSPRNNLAKRQSNTPNSAISYQVKLVLARNCERPINDDSEETESSDESYNEDNIRSEDYQDMSGNENLSSLEENKNPNDLINLEPRII